MSNHTYNLSTLWLLTAALTFTTGCVESPDSVMMDPDELYASLDRSATGLHDYAGKVRGLHGQAAELGTQALLTTITLKRPITPEAAEAFMRRHTIEAPLAYAFARDPSGATATIMVKRTGSLANLRNIAEHNDAELIGVVAIVGELSSARLSAVDEDPSVFLVDISADQNFAVNPGNTRHMPSFAWDLFHQTPSPSR
jgi:hypothetical protein